MAWKKHIRPGYFGRRRDEIIAQFNKNYGEGGWKIMWDGGIDCPVGPYEFEKACRYFYEVSYRVWFMLHAEEQHFLRGYGECMDNALTNIISGRDYTKQEAYSTHIQDIAVRNVMHTLGWKFEGPSDRILVIRSRDSAGYKYGPGNIPFYAPHWIAQPSLCPTWANPGSVEDFWQSNKWVWIK